MDSDNEIEYDIMESSQVDSSSPKKEENPKKPKKSKIDPAVGDRRKTTSVANIEKARKARLERIQKQIEAARNTYEVEESSSSEDEETELVLTKKKKKPALITAQEARLMKLELMLEKMALQEKAKKPKKEKTLKIEIQPQVQAPAKNETLKKKILLDL